MKDHSIKKRALRRHHMDRLKRKRATYWFGKEDNNERKLGILVSSPHPCSCSACGNPRRNGWDKKHTVQERKYFQESIEENMEGHRD